MICSTLRCKNRAGALVEGTYICVDCLAKTCALALHMLKEAGLEPELKFMAEINPEKFTA